MRGKEKDRRIRTSTLAIFVTAAVAGVFILTFSYAHAWGKYEELIESRSDVTVFAAVDLEDLEGNRLTAEELSDTKLVAYNVWETTCAPCIAEMEALEELSKEYDPSEFRLAGICADLYDKEGNLRPEQLEKAGQLMKDKGVTFPILIPDEGFRDYIRSSVAGFPTTFFVDSEGNLLSTATGARSLEDWKKYVDDELEKLR